MTPRPSISRKQRPLSAIFIGSVGSSSASSTPPDLPNLPEPPSPEDSSPPSRSGLPSPPATNSTGSGSGSNGDDSTNAGSLRQRKSQRPYSVSDMYNASRNRSRTDAPSASSSALSDEDDDPNDHDNDHDEDTTARFDLHRRRSTNTAPSDHSSALQRVKSLTERNRMILDKLSSMSRQNSPVPPKPSRTSHSPSHTPSPTPQGSSRPSSAARNGATSAARSESMSLARSRLLRSQVNSGSETERESSRSRPISHTYSSSESLSTPTSQHSEVVLYPTAGEPSRPRRISAPSSPAQGVRSAKLSDRNQSPPPSPGPSKARTPRKRASMAVTANERGQLRHEEDGEVDVMSAALAAVASSRRSRSPGGTGAGSVSRRGLSRNPLPREFRDQDLSARSSEHTTPYTPHRERNTSRVRRSPSPSVRASSSQVSLPPPSSSTNGHYSPRRHGTPSKTSTVRELTRKHQTRWLSEDLSASSAHGDIEDNPGTPSRSATSQTHYSSGRRPTGRGGSDGPLSPGRSLLGEGLRAAGITRKRDTATGDDPFASTPPVTHHAAPVRRTRSTGANSVVQGGVEWDSPVQVTPSSRLGDRTSARYSGDYNAHESRVSADRASSSTTSSLRPGTSMAALHHDSPATGSRGNSSATRAYASTHTHHLSLSSMRGDDSLDTIVPPHGRDTYPSPFSATSSRPSTAASGVLRDNHAEHRRLMLEALSMFESHLSRLPPMGQTTTSTIPEVFQSSQQLVHGLDRLNSHLRTATSRALEAQIDAEVSDAVDESAAEIWASVGGEHREHLRQSDEIVRTMTQFLLGVGKVIRDASGSASAQQHLRSVSMDDEVGRRLTPEVTSATSDKRSSDGRLSRETRRSWDPREPGSANRLATADRSSNGSSSRASASIHHPPRSSITSSSEGRSPNDGVTDQTPPATRHISSAASSISSRRLYTPREQRLASDPVPKSHVLTNADSQETLHGHEPSPSPAPRPVFAERTRALPPLAIPPSLPTLPSESLLSRSSTTSALDRSRRKVSSNSNTTVRAESSLPSVLKPPNTTTALTPATVSNADLIDTSPSLSRSDSDSSTHTNGVTFSRPSTVSSSTLSSLQKHTSHSYRARTVSDQLKEELRSPMSGSETERPRTVGVRGRTSLDGPRGDSLGRSSQASTLTSARRERRRTITEIFAQADH